MKKTFAIWSAFQVNDEVNTKLKSLKKERKLEPDLYVIARTGPNPN